MELREILQTLCAINAPSGFEQPVGAWAADYLAPFADEVRQDAMGNLIAVKRCGRPGAKKLMLDAHMDEVGFVVTGYEKGGYLRFSALGGIDARMLPTLGVTVLTQPPLYGVIDTMPPHILSEEDMKQAVPIDRLVIDTGLTEEEARRLIPIGTGVSYAVGMTELMGGRLCGKSFDDRSCAAILLRAFEELSQKELSVDLYCVLSAQEEVGCRGAKAAAGGILPDYAIVVDVTHANTPDEHSLTVELGGGAAVGIGPNMNHAMTQHILRLAKREDIPVQKEVCPGGSSGTNAAVIQVSGCGVATALLSLPLRYMHSPSEVIDFADMENTLRLITAFVPELEAEA